ncbi:MAG: hypothetical protein ISS79_07085 [Phycisphaerae bacterium]|nr:hypothetical protein [Phycisphaerae bacterium]
MQNTPKKLSLLTFALLFSIICPAFAAKVIYVDANAPGANDGSSWAHAFYYLQDALMRASSGDEIHVAQGVYRPDDFVLSHRPNLGRAETFHLKTGLILKGGYAGLGEPDPNVRDIELYETILSGDIGENDATVNHPAALPEEPTRAENSYHVVTAADTDATAVLDGFTITAGNANLDWEHESGGGMIIDSADPIIRNCTFRHNSAFADERGRGGGLANEGGNPTLEGCTFIENAIDTGIRDHGAGNGGGMYSRDGATVVDCRFIRNCASGNDGGAMFVSGEHTLTNCLFFENSARMYGGAVYGSGDMTGCTFIGNEAASQWGIGGAVYGSGDMTGCTFIGNRAGQGAGALKLGGRDNLLINCLFAGNAAKGSGGGILIWPSGDRTLVNCTFAGNRASAGRALASGSHDDRFSNIALTNCILRDGGDEIANFDGSTMTITHTNLQGGQTATQDPHDAIVWGAGNFDADPYFPDPGHWHNSGTPEDANDDVWINGDYHLKSQAGRWNPTTRTWPPHDMWIRDDITSPCIDAGDPFRPIGHEPFPNGGIINIGAYGGTARASKSYFGRPPCETIVAGDINGDCVVNFLDFRLMALHWMMDYDVSAE